MSPRPDLLPLGAVRTLIYIIVPAEGHISVVQTPLRTDPIAPCTEQPLGECRGYEAELHSPWGLQEVSPSLPLGSPLQSERLGGLLHGPMI